jgi:hypothetical protein
MVHLTKTIAGGSSWYSSISRAPKGDLGLNIQLRDAPPGR